MSVLAHDLPKTLSEMDRFFVELLTNQAGWPISKIQRLQETFRDQQDPQQTLIAFLTAQGVLTDTANGTLSAMQKGYLRIDNLAGLFGDAGLTTLDLLAQPKTPTKTPPNSDRPAPVPASTRRLSRPALYSTSERANSSNKDDGDLDNGPPLPDVGSRLGKCLLTEKLGQGGWGVVYRALHTSLNISVAVKILRPEAVRAFPDVYKQFHREAQLLAQLNHPNIVRVLNFEDEGPYPYLVMEYVEGLSLFQLIEQCGRVRADRALGIVRQVAEALSAAYAMRIIHRDVTPGNILLAKDGKAKMTDFGLAMLSSDRANGADDDSVGPGTPAYMSPEQAKASGEPLDHRSDQYALGASFYHAVTGRPPFEGDSSMVLLVKHATEDPVPPDQLVPGLPTPISSIILRMLEKNAIDRFESYPALIAGLDSLRLDQAQSRPSDTSGWKSFLPQFRRQRRP